ncbi:MAG TPA: PstS family phosphate ABC transporter substrate-binding protein [Solirubrobacteraceae bacterium]|nr:PstS family phosphate ABC transporter substrate-binding protein [Solirubrobacteraceae bacterium]
MQPIRVTTTFALCAALALGAAACGEDEAAQGGGLSGQIRIDGSSTVFPFAQAAAEQFMAENPDVEITVGQSGTGGGFEKFCAGETDVSTASRPIKEDEEVPLCQEAGVDYTELQVANDGIAVVSNKDLAIDCLTTAQLEELWANDEVESYAEIDPKLPDREVSLFGPGTDSGTFDFFTGEINGEEGRTRKDYQPSEDDNVLVQGIGGDEGGLGYFGFSYYEQNADKLNLIGIDAGEGCVEPSLETIQSGEYEPLARPIFMYPSAEALQRPEVKAFMEHLLENQRAIAENAQIVPMTDEQTQEAERALSGGAA